jgi:hypothetical protein
VLHRRTIWTGSRIDRLAGESLTILTRICQAFESRTVPLSDGRIAWGQYLDDAHFSASQWGIFGTSAALQTLAMGAASSGNVPSGEPLISAALPLPNDRDTTDPAFNEKRTPAKNDFENVVKLAFIADGLALDSPTNVLDGSTPLIVDQLISMAIADQRWSSRLPVDPHQSSKDQDFPTTLLISVLRRFERFRQHPMWDRSRHWLANRILQDGSFR